MKKRTLTGIQPSGTPHLGNYLGAIRPALALQDTHACFFFIASYHALTTARDAAALRQRVLEVAATWLACGLDPARTVLWAQHDVPEVTELAWILGCYTGTGLLDKAHAFKDAVARQKADVINAGLYTYPVLMAADILAFDSDLVPVGQDQKQHIEITRDIAARINHHYGEVLHLPEPLIQADVATVPGIDGQKMSKSYGNTIPLFLPSKQLRKRIMEIQTDSTPLEAPKDPEASTVFALYKLVAAPDQVAEMAAAHRAGGYGHGHAKQALFEALDARFAEARERYTALLAAPAELEAILDDGAHRARAVARETLRRVRDVVGLHSFARPSGGLSTVR